ncbi:MAG: hypothetical protein HQK54_00270 [Oligoflexales bacterium]|nr:hypothetical protein [Oligoflexales bacterium]
MSPRFYIKYLLFFLPPVYLYAGESSNIEKISTSNSDMNFFSEHYITYELAKNTTLIHTQEHYSGYHVTYVIGYRHSMQNKWIAGISTSFKSLMKKDCGKSDCSVPPGEEEPESVIGDELSFVTLTHEILYAHRLYYPSYILLGPKFHYMLPTKRSRFPLLKDGDYDLEIGAAFSLSFVTKIFPKWLLTARVDRWRGTKTNRFHGTEVAFGFNYEI